SACRRCASVRTTPGRGRPRPTRLRAPSKTGPEPAPPPAPAAFSIMGVMEYTRLGSTGLKVSRLCLGVMIYGSKKWREWVLEEEESRPFLKRALEAGINFFDTADVYSRGVSEEILGRAMKDFGPPRDRLVIATKVFNAMGSDPNQAGLS